MCSFFFFPPVDKLSVKDYVYVCIMEAKKVKDKRGKNISASAVSAEIMVYCVQGLGTKEDETESWSNFFLLLGIKSGSSLADAIQHDIGDLAWFCDPDEDPNGFMLFVKDYLKDYVRAQYY
jgi:hypothetical protein